MRKVNILALSVIGIILTLSIVGPFLNPFTHNIPKPHLTHMPPRIPVLERFGIFDGSAVLRNRRAAHLDDPEIYPDGAVLRVLNSRLVAGVEMVDVVVCMYIMNDIQDVYFWFGTDYLGRDLWTRLWRGARLSLFIALTAVLINTVIGVIFGVVCGYYGGKADLLLMRLTEILDALPQIAVFTLLIIMIGPGVFSIILALCIRGWTATARLTRVQFFRHKGDEYVLASKTMGARDLRLIMKHILPNAIGPVITRAVAAVPGAIFLESFLAFLGLGIAAPETSLGVLLADGRLTLLESPFQTLFPAVVLSLLMLSFNALSMGLRESLDPKNRN